MISLFLLSYISLTSSQLCSNSSCLSCKDLIYDSTSCLLICPSTYFINLNSCSSPTDLNYLVVHTEFGKFLEFSATSIGKFKTINSISFENDQRTTPVPTYDRGFYFGTNSYLVAINPLWIIAPRFTIFMLIRLSGAGTILTVSDNSITWMKIRAYNGKIIVSIQLTEWNNVNNVVKLQDIDFGQITYGKWTILYVRGIQSSVGASFRYNDQVFSLSNAQIRMNSENFDYSLGSLSGSFIGFLYELVIMNYEQFFYDNFEFLPECDFGTFNSSGQCVNCFNPINWINCIRYNSALDYCVSSICSNCSGFGPENCSQCSAGNYQLCLQGRNCNAGFAFNCNSCLNYSILIDGLCVNQPSSISPTCIQFEPFVQTYGGLLSSGLKPETYAPYNNPESDDPFPYPNRGMYIKDPCFFSSQVILNYKFSIGFMVRAYDDNYLNLLLDSNRLKVSTSGAVKIILKNYNIEKFFTNPGICMGLEKWKIVSVLVNFDGNHATFTTICSDYQISNTVYGFAYYPGEFLTIGSGNSKFFLYRVYMSQTYNDAVSSCLNSGSSSLIDVKYSYYNNTFLNQILDCPDLCAHGCMTWGTCNNCQDINCFECTNGFFTVCDKNSTYNPCLPGLVLSVNQKICCDPACTDCFESDIHSCFGCRTNYFLHDYSCFGICPVSYQTNNQVCIKFTSNSPVLDAILYYMTNEFVDNYNNKFSNGDSSNFYPN